MSRGFFHGFGGINIVSYGFAAPAAEKQEPREGFDPGQLQFWRVMFLYQLQQPVDTPHGIDTVRDIAGNFIKNQGWV